MITDRVLTVGRKGDSVKVTCTAVCWVAADLFRVGRRLRVTALFCITIMLMLIHYKYTALPGGIWSDAPHGPYTSAVYLQ